MPCELGVLTARLHGIHPQLKELITLAKLLINFGERKKNRNTRRNQREKERGCKQEQSSKYLQSTVIRQVL